jgi:hypothetical protein
MNLENLKIYESPAIIKHLEFYQSIISRMANNSASCKTWSITLTSALIVLSIDKSNISIWISLIPILIFYFLDSFYLGLEREFRDSYNEFLVKLNTDAIEKKDIYKIVIKPRNFWFHLWLSISNLFAYATFMFYAPIIAVIVILDKWIL